MKIVFLVPGTITSIMGFRALAFAKQLHKHGHTVAIIAPRFDKHSHFKDTKISEIEGVRIIRPWQPKHVPFLLSLIPYMASAIFLLLKCNPDIVHISKANPITVVGLIAKIFRSTPVIFDVDDLDSEVMKIENNPKALISLVEVSEKILGRNATAIITASKYLYRLYKTRYPNKEIIYVPNGADFVLTKNIPMQKLSDNRILFVGAMNRINILEPLFHAVKNLKEKNIEVEVVIVGSGAYLTYFKKLAKKLGVSQYIQFLGWVKQHELQKHVQPGDLGYSYMPNEDTIKACSSMKVFQYMQYGVIPVVSNVGDFPYYVSNGKAGYVVKHTSVDDLTETLGKALKQKTDRKEKIAYAKTNAPKKYSWSKLASDVEKLYYEQLITL